ncbi:hypothetical protein BH20ACT20_BH20ACT20_01190 [soil metagenome]
MIGIAAVIATATAVGFGVEHRLGERAEAIAKKILWLMLWVLLPPVVFFNIATLELTADIGAGIGFAYAALLVVLGAAYVVGTYVLRLPRPAVGALMVVSALANTGYLGLPFSAALFGLDELPSAIAYDIVVSTIALVTIGFSIGAAFGTVAERPRERAVAFFSRNPALWAFGAALIAPAVLTPDWAVDASRVVVFGILPLGFFVVGVTLAAEADEGGLRFPPPFTRSVGAAVGLRLLLAPAIMLALSQGVHDVPESYLSQAGMASAINGLVIAHEYGLDRALVASVIAWSTAIVVGGGLVLALV